MPMIEKIFSKNRENVFVKLNKHKLTNWIDDLYKWMFSIDDENCSFNSFEANYLKSKEVFYELLISVTVDEKQRLLIVENLYSKLEEIHSILLGDLEAIFKFDPAAKNKSEIIFSYPGFYAISVYRISHELWKAKLPVIPRVISEYVHNKTGIDIHPGATIGKDFFIDHGTGIVIGETAIIGDNVKIYQGVTLGALNVLKEEAEIKRHPTIEDDVVIYANATILGGKTVIGKKSVIGGNVWVSNSIPADSLVFNKSEIIIKSNKVFPEPLNFVI